MRAEQTKRSGERGGTLRIVVFGALWATVSAAALMAPGCYGRNCEGGIESYGVDAGQGDMLDENTWESAPIDGEWLWFPGQRTYIFDMRALGGRMPDVPIAYISASPQPSKTGDFTTGAGNLLKFLSPRPNGINVYNDSCSDYYVRLVIKARPFPPSVNTDAGATPVDADAGADLDAAINNGEDAGDGGDGGDGG
ncbi:MAG TPA: hypothetical protein VM925_14375 [Labilithrix sp.]|jgi:hypothetical protein|nr:hypothetical protein [Labilithrix sp.]